MELRASPEEVAIVALGFRVPRGYVTIDELWKQNEATVRNVYDNVLTIPKLKSITLEEIGGVHTFDGEEEGTLVLEAISELLKERALTGRDIPLIVDFSTVSRDVNGISLCYKVQARLGAHGAMTLAIGNGSCVGLQLAIQTALALMHTHDLRFALLFAEDRIRGRRFNPPFNVLGDGASALLLERGVPSLRIRDTANASVGRLSRILGIHHWEEGNFDFAGFEERIVPLHYHVVRELIEKVLHRQGLRLAQIDLVLYQNMSLNDCHGLAGTLGLGMERVFTGGLRSHGHIFGSDLIINLSLARAEGRIRSGSRVLLVSSGAGFSWGVTLLEA